MKKRKADLGYKGGLEGWGNPVTQYNPGMHAGLFQSLCLNSFSMLRKKKKEETAANFYKCMVRF